MDNTTPTVEVDALNQCDLPVGQRAKDLFLLKLTEKPVDIEKMQQYIADTKVGNSAPSLPSSLRDLKGFAGKVIVQDGALSSELKAQIGNFETQSPRRKVLSVKEKEKRKLKAKTSKRSQRRNR